MNDTIIEVRHAQKYFGRVHALNDVSLTVRPREVVIIIGPSGSGKSTLLRSINHLETLTSGEIYIDKMLVTDPKVNINTVRAEVGMVFQQFNLFPHMTALENISLAQRVVRQRSQAEAEKVARDLLDKVGIPEKADMNPKIMLFDEPTSALDPEMITEVLDVMQDLARDGMTMLVVSHEMGFARAAATRILFMDAGQLLEDTTPELLYSNPQHERTKQFLSKILH